MYSSLAHLGGGHISEHDIYFPEKVVGILGGMGPESTADLFFRIIRATPVKKDQDHLIVIVYNNPKIPDRTLAIVDNEKCPLQQIKESISVLDRMGVDIIAIPCNTAHFYYNDLQRSTNVPIINMLSETSKYIYKTFPKVTKIGLLATTGTIDARLYHKVLNKTELISPNKEDQEKIMNLIYGTEGIKAGHITKKLKSDLIEIIMNLVKRDIDIIIAGCTELSLVISPNDLPVPLVDPVQILAECVVKYAKCSALPRVGDKLNNRIRRMDINKEDEVTLGSAVKNIDNG